MFEWKGVVKECVAIGKHILSFASSGIILKNKYGFIPK